MVFPIADWAFVPVFGNTNVPDFETLTMRLPPDGFATVSLATPMKRSDAVAGLRGTAYPAELRATSDPL